MRKPNKNVQPILLTVLIATLMVSGIFYCVEQRMMQKKIAKLQAESCNNYTSSMVPIRVFFTTKKNNENLNNCGKTDSVIRYVPKNVANDINDLAEEALRQLFIGPTDQEKKTGLLEEYWSGDKTGQDPDALGVSNYFKRVFVKNGVAYIDWKEFKGNIANASTSCGMATFGSPLHDTLSQFPEIKKIVQAFDGDPAKFAEFMQGACRGVDCDKTPFKQ